MQGKANKPTTPSSESSFSKSCPVELKLTTVCMYNSTAAVMLVSSLSFHRKMHTKMSVMLAVHQGLWKNRP